MPIEPAGIAAGMTAMGHAVNIVKILTGTLQAMGKAEMVTQLIDLQNTLLDIQQKQMELLASNQALADENRKLLEQANLQKHLKFVGRVYQIEGLGNIDGHYCQKCYDADRKLVRVQRFDNGDDRGWHCENCAITYYDGAPPQPFSAFSDSD